MSMRNWAPVVILASSALAMFAGLAASPSPLRSVLVVWFLAVCPGLAAVGLLRLRDPWLVAALVPALSFAMDIIVAGILSYAGLWSAAAVILILVAISVSGALLQDVVAERLLQHGKVS